MASYRYDDEFENHRRGWTWADEFAPTPEPGCSLCHAPTRETDDEGEPMCRECKREVKP